MASALRRYAINKFIGSQVEKLTSGLTLVALPHNQPIVRVMVGFPAGSRHETAHAWRGASHALRSAAGLSTRRYTEHGLANIINQMGGEFEACSDREFLVYKMGVRRDHLHTACRILAQISTEAELFPWELSSLEAKMMLDVEILTRRNQEALLIDLLHESAFFPGLVGGGLGNSTYCVPHALSSVLDTDVLSKFREERCTAAQATVFGYGLELDELRRVVESHFSTLMTSRHSNNTKDKTQVAPKFRSNDIRVSNGHPLAQVALVVPGLSRKNQLHSALGVAARLLGCGGHRVSYGSNRHAGRLREAIVDHHQCSVSAVHLAYEDAGLFGIHLTGAASSVSSALRVARQTLLKIVKQGITAGPDFEAAKCRFVTDLFVQIEKPHDMMHHLLCEGETDVLGALKRVLDVTPEHVTEALRSVIVEGRPAMASVGDLRSVLSIDEIY